MNKLPHILICDDDPVVHESLGLYLLRGLSLHLGI